MSLARIVVVVFCLSSAACAIAPEEPGSTAAPLKEKHVELRPMMAAPRSIALPVRIGCAHDADCDDGNACTLDACVDHRCRNDLIDHDGDGFAPASLGACGSDCNDDDVQVFPGQKAWFTTPSAGSFDYDCDGSANKEHDDLALCIGAATKEAEVCTCAPGWEGVVAECGVTASFATATSCGATASIDRTQACH